MTLFKGVKNGGGGDGGAGSSGDEHEGMDKAALEAHERLTRVKTIGSVQIGISRSTGRGDERAPGGHILRCWYFSPYPKEVSPADCLYICEFCLRFFKRASELARHSAVCTARFPPGNEMYRDDHLSLFEIDGELAPEYCENLCYLSKLFLDHKTLQFDVHPFLFYVLTECDASGCHIVGYFSKEKVSARGYNLACILTLPHHQRKGYGKLLISLSYELSLREGKQGGPERPLSDLGRASYRAFWIEKLIHGLRSLPADQHMIPLDDLVRMTAIHQDDVKKTLEEIGVLTYVNGSHVLYSEEGFLCEKLKECGCPCRPIRKNGFQWIPYHCGPPPAHEALPPKT